ncbi:MAG TPA: VOC family protein, partial [Hyphomonas sp.]|nr:VOC family protein [Hyphomonas sp.]
KWLAAGLDVFEIDHNWCHSIYTKDPNDNAVEFCLTSGTFTEADRQRALDALSETEFKPSPPPAFMQMWNAEKSGR